MEKQEGDTGWPSLETREEKTLGHIRGTVLRCPREVRGEGTGEKISWSWHRGDPVTAERQLPHVESLSMQGLKLGGT